MQNTITMFTSFEMAQHIAQVFSPLNLESIRALSGIIFERKFKKGDIVLEEGAICKSMLIVEKGLLRQYYYKHKRDLTEHISYEDGLIICIESYFREEPTRIIIEALENAIIWAIPKDKIESLAFSNPEIGLLYRKMLEWSLIESQIKADTLRFESASDRYTKLMQKHPEIIKRTPLVYIASLLQMTPETLSRVRSGVINNIKN